MAKKRAESPGRGRLLDAWVAPSDAGAPVGCLATSYTFDSVFFEEECLGRFAGIRSGSSVEDKGWEWIIEREDRFAQIKAVALVDKDHCHGPRSPRWDLLCARGGANSGILHAKLSLLVWANHVRLIVASANLTPSGYRKNREVYACLDAGQDMPVTPEAWKDALDYLGELLALGGGDDHPGVIRAGELIQDARERVRKLEDTGKRTDLSVRFFGLGPDKVNLFRGLAGHWKEEASGPVNEAHVISPFFDPNPKIAGKTRQELWGLVRERGEASVNLYGPMEVEPNGRKRLWIPEAWNYSPRATTRVTAYGIVEVDEKEKDRRPLHAKWYRLENEDWALSCSGSANLTAAGTGLSNKPNWEAMLSVLLKCQRSKEEYNLMTKAWESIGGTEATNAFWAGVAEDEEERVEAGVEPLPEGFEKAIYQQGTDQPELVLYLGEKLPPQWGLWIPQGDLFVDSVAWQAAGRPKPWTTAWKPNAAPSGLELHWGQEDEKRAWLPVCVLDARQLPPPEELRNLSLEVLIEVLTTARPLAQTLAAWIKRKHAGENDGSALLDPHARVDVSGYLIPRTRRVSKALTALREKLCEPATTEEALKWRLEGPFGAKAVAEAVIKEARDVEETVFFLSELCLELAQVKPSEVPGCLEPAKVLRTIRAFILNQSQTIESYLGQASPAIRGYAQVAMKKCGEGE